MVTLLEPFEHFTSISFRLDGLGLTIAASELLPIIFKIGDTRLKVFAD